MFLWNLVAGIFISECSNITEYEIYLFYVSDWADRVLSVSDSLSFIYSVYNTDMRFPLWARGLGCSWVDISKGPLCGKCTGISSCAWGEEKPDTSTGAAD